MGSAGLVRLSPFELTIFVGLLFDLKACPCMVLCHNYLVQLLDYETIMYSLLEAIHARSFHLFKN